MSIQSSHLEQAERDARMRLERYRAKIYSARYVDPMTSQIRLAELERKWKFALDQLHKARADHAA